MTTPSGADDPSRRRSRDDLTSRARVTVGPPAADDLPRSPSGRIPQWVVDEAAGRVPTDTAWRPSAPVPYLPPPPPRRRRTGTRLGALLVVLLLLGGAGWVATEHSDWVRTAGARVAAALPQATRPVPAPSAEVVTLADDAHLSQAGRALLYAARPVLADATEFAGRCSEGHEGAGAVGCYQSGAGTIVIYAPSDPRLHPFVVTTAAHETLHAAWATLPRHEQTTLAPILEAELARLPADAQVREQIDASVGSHPENRPTELFAYLGTQVWRDGGLDPHLEQVYARFVTDRAALVGVDTAFEANLTAMRDRITTESAALTAAETANATARGQYEADAASVEACREEYAKELAQVAALDPARRAALRLSWTWWDGTKLAMAPADTTLARAAKLLARDDRDLPARAAALTSAEAAASADRARVAGLVDDLNGLITQMTPPGGAR